MKKHRLGTEPKEVPFRNNSNFIIVNYNYLSIATDTRNYAIKISRIKLVG